MAASATGKNLTPSNAAKDDFLTVDLGAPGKAVALNVLANDPGSARVYSLFQHPETLGKKEAFPVVTSLTLASGAVVKMQPDGTLSYTPPANAGGDYSETFFYTARMANGTLSVAEVHLTVRGAAPVNHAPVLAAVEPVVVHDDSLPAPATNLHGVLTAQDPDPGATLRYALAPDSVADTRYGTFTLQPDGRYSFVVDPAALDALAAGEVAEVSFMAVAIDERGGTSAPTAIRFTLVGADEVVPAAEDDVFLSLDTGLNEDQLLIQVDVLANDSPGAVLYSVSQQTTAPVPAVTTALAPSGATVNVNADGTLTYDARVLYNNLQGLAQGQTWIENFYYTARMTDGQLSTALVSVEIAGVNDAPVLRTGSTLVFDGPGADETQTIAGQLTATDVDAGSRLSFALAPGESGHSQYGDLVVREDGAYEFTVDAAALDALIDGDVRVASFDVVAADELGALSTVESLLFYLIGRTEPTA